MTRRYITGCDAVHPDRRGGQHVGRAWRRECVNPAHLEPVTNRINVLRGDGVSAKNATLTHCKWGHELSPDNVAIKYNARRRITERACIECRRRRGTESNRKVSAKAKAARAIADHEVQR